MSTPAYEQIRAALALVPPKDRDTWLRMAMAVKSSLGEDGFELWDLWSQTDESYNARAAESTWCSIRSTGKVTIATLFYEAKRHGWQEKRDGNRQASSQAAPEQKRRRLEGEDTERGQRLKKAKARVAEIWNAARPATDDHPYAKAKGVKPHGLRLYHGRLTIKEVSCDGALIVPLRDSSGQLRSLEFITDNGEKRFFPGGRKSGHYFTLGEADAVLVISEGWATGAAIHQATGYATAIAFDAGNMRLVAEALRNKFPRLRFVLAADNDLDKKRNVGVETAHKAARAVDGLVAIPELNGAKCDFADVLKALGANAVRAAIDAAEPVGAEPNTGARNGAPRDESARIVKRIAELAKLSPVDYELIRRNEAKALRVRQFTLDEHVEEQRRKRAGSCALTFEDPEPWLGEVVGAELLSRIRAEIQRYIVLPPHGSTAIALWVLHTWCIDASFITPFLHVRSPEKRCGKTNLMILIREFVRRPLLASSASSPVIFRSIQRFQPTLLLDEADTWVPENEQLRGVLNGGHSRKSATVLRVVGDDYEPQAFSTYCAKALAGIGRLADTLEDRSIGILLKRKRVQDGVARLREDRLDGLEIRRQCLAWSKACLERLRVCDPETPPVLNDRAADNWRALLAIADVAGGEWPQKARDAAVALSGATDDEAVGPQLLADIRDWFARDGSPAVFSEDLVKHLIGLEDRPWAEWGKPPKPISQNQVARLLKRFEIRPRDVRLRRVAKGYRREHFEDAFARYLPLGSSSATARQPDQFGSQSHGPDRYSDLDAKRDNATDAAECSGVAAEGALAVADQDGTKHYENGVCSAVAEQEGGDRRAQCTEEVF